MASSDNNIKVSEELLLRLEAKASAEGRNVNEVAEAALREVLHEKSWQELLARGRQYGQASAIDEDRVPDIVREYRKENRER